MGQWSSEARAMRDANATNLQIAKETNETSKDIAESNNEWQERLSQANNLFNHDEAELAWQRTIRQPVEMMKSYQEAGLNPSVAMAGNVGYAAGSSPSAQASGSGVSPSMPTLHAGHVEPVPGNRVLVDKFLDIAKAGKALSESGLDVAHTSEVNKMVDENVRAVRLQNFRLNLENDLFTTFGRYKEIGNLQEIGARVANFYSAAFEASANGKWKIADAALSDARKAMYEASAKLSGAQRHEVDKNIQWFDEKMSSEIYKNRAEGAAYEADIPLKASQSGLNEAEIQRIQKLLPGEVTLLHNNVKQVAVEVMQAWEEYNNTKLSPEQRALLQQKITQDLEHEVTERKGQQWNPIRYVAWSISPLAEEIGIALGGNAGVNASPSPKVRRVVGFK